MRKEKNLQMRGQKAHRNLVAGLEASSKLSQGPFRPTSLQVVYLSLAVSSNTVIYC